MRTSFLKAGAARSRGDPRSASALVIVLGFVVLLTVVVVVFLSWSLLDRKISTSNAKYFNTRDFAQGAVNSIVGDLQQEIAAGSVATNTTPSGTAHYVYQPISGRTGVPSTVGFTRQTDATGMESDGLANLVKVSCPAAGGAFYPASADYQNFSAAPAPNRGSMALTTTASLNGRYISLARWNKHLLLQKKSPGSTDTTPVTAFPTPAWVLVSRDGSDPAAWSAGLGDSTQSQFVVGRYAYAIYDEGGLLDANVAGYPGSLPAANVVTAPASRTGAQVGAKTAASFADLTQLGLTTAQVDTLVGWRNYASAQAGGAFPTYSLGSASAAAYFQSVLSATNGFMTVGNTALNNGQSDRVFPSRQSLISFFIQGLARNDTDRANFQNILQYLGTFSRDLDQPSYWPDPNRPRVGGAYPPSYTNYQGNNDAAGEDDVINPPFPTVVVQHAFSRYDQSTAAVGEPLVKKRFPLSRLAWLTYLGPSAGHFSSADPGYQAIVKAGGITQGLLDQGTDANILACFGLAWNASGAWTYNHGSPDGHILKLSEVAALNREPDMVELMKAAIATGSLGKSSDSSNYNPVTDPLGLFQFTYDTTTDYQVMQIFANVVAQFSADGYPPWIQFNNGTGVRNFYGIENLPYVQQVIASMVAAKKPAPLMPLAGPNFGVDGNGTTGPQYANGAALYGGMEAVVADPATHLPAPVSLAVTDSGVGVYLVHPILWNPHDANSSPGTPAPTSFQVTMESRMPDDTVLPGIATFPMRLVDSNTSSNFTTPRYLNQTKLQTIPSFGYMGGTYYTTGVSLTTANSELDFTAPPAPSTLFREPTVLREAGIPAGSALALGPGNSLSAGVTFQNVSGLFVGESGLAPASFVADTNTAVPDSRHYVGTYIGAVPLRWTRTDSDGYLASGVSDNAQYDWTLYGAKFKLVPLPGFPNSVASATVRLGFKNSQGAWQTYDEKLFGNLASIENLGMNNATDTGGGITYSDQWKYNAKCGAAFYDPRTARFGDQSAGNTGFFMGGNVSPSPSSVVGNQQNDWYGNTGVPGSVIPTLTQAILNGMGWFVPQSGGGTPLPLRSRFAQNNPTLTYTDLAGSPGPNYYQDPDGVVRRGTAAYLNSPVLKFNPPAMGLPSATAYNIASNAVYSSYPSSVYPGTTIAANQAQSRPIVLNRPFRSVAELAYAFRGAPFKNIDFGTPQSGDAGLLDVFCVNDDSRPDAVASGRVNLNTRQLPVLEAVLAGASRDETLQYPQAPLTAAEAKSLGAALIKRTSNLASPSQGPLLNLSQLVGKYVPGAKNNTVDPLGPYYSAAAPGYYDGFSNDVATLGLYAADATGANTAVQRYLETAIRALADAGTTRTWNLLIDVVTQTGRYPAAATGLDQFLVQGEQHCWVHVAIDRYTGNVIDESIEPVKE